MRALLVVPGLMGCALVVGGLTSGNDLMAGIGFGLAGLALVSFFALKISDASAAAAERRRIWKNGRPATARVIASWFATSTCRGASTKSTAPRWPRCWNRRSARWSRTSAPG